MNKGYALVILLQSSFLWSAASGLEAALVDLHNDMRDIKGNMATAAQHSSQLPIPVEKVDALLGIGQSLLCELRQQNAHLEISAKAQALSALAAHRKLTVKGHSIPFYNLLAEDLAKHIQPKK